MNVPHRWRQINDVCIGVPDGDGYSYTVFHVGEQSRDGWKWEAWKGKELLAMNLDSMEAAIAVCREDYRRLK